MNPRANNGPRPRPGGRGGFSVLETVAAAGLLALVLVLVADIGLGSLAERRRLALRQEAVESAANVLEAARAVPWDGLTAEWAAAQRLPESVAQRLPGARLTVGVAPDKAGPHTRRVTVAVAWRPTRGAAAQSVALVGLFSARSGPGGKP